MATFRICDLFVKIEVTAECFNVYGIYCFSSKVYCVTQFSLFITKQNWTRLFEVRQQNCTLLSQH